MAQNELKPLIAQQTDNTMTTRTLNERMQLALNGVLHRGETPTCAARKWNLNRTTLLHRLVREKQRLNLNGSTSSKLFQSKFTSKQLLSALQEQQLAQYLKQRYDMQCPNMSQQAGTTTRLPLLSEEMARSFTHNFVHMHHLRYPNAWDAKQQAASDWFNGFVDRNPEIIQYVEAVTKVRKQRKSATQLRAVKAEKCKDRQPNFDIVDAVVAVNGLEVDGDLQSNIDYDLPNVHKNDAQTPLLDYTATPIKIEQFEYENHDFNSSTLAIDFLNYANESAHTEIEHNYDPMIPELVYKTPDASLDEQPEQAPRSIAESVKRRTQRKARIRDEHMYTAMQTKAEINMKKRQQLKNAKRSLQMPNEELCFQNGDDNNEHPIKIQRVQTFCPTFKQQRNCHSKLSDEQPDIPQTSIQSGFDKLKDTIEKMHADMNYLLQSLLMEISENNRLLRRLVAGNEQIP